MKKPGTKIPTARLLSFISGIRKDPQKYFYRLFKEKGDLVKLSFPKKTYLISNPLLAKEFLIHANKELGKKDLINNRMRNVFGNGIITSEGEVWLRNRKTLSGSFHRSSIEKYELDIRRRIELRMKEWESSAENGTMLILQHEMKLLALSIMAYHIIGTDLSNQLDPIILMLEKGARILSHSIPVKFTFGPVSKSEKQLADILNQIELIGKKIISEKRGNYHSDGLDMFSLFFRHEKETGEIIPDRLLLDEFKSLLIAGYFTTGDALSWTFIELARNPEWMQKISHEIDSEKKHHADSPGKNQRLPFMNAFIHESLRTSTPVWSAWYSVDTDIEVNGHIFSRGSNMMLDLFNIHHHPQFFKDPDQFDPGRFLNGDTGKTSEAFMPFGHGPRKCVGVNLAMSIITNTVEMVLSQFDVIVPDAHKIDSTIMVTRSPEGPVKFILRKRTNAH